jgi:hypothetical protein
LKEYYSYTRLHEWSAVATSSVGRVEVMVFEKSKDFRQERIWAASLGVLLALKIRPTHPFLLVFSES